MEQQAVRGRDGWRVLDDVDDDELSKSWKKDKPVQANAGLVCVQGWELLTEEGTLRQ